MGINGTELVEVLKLTTLLTKVGSLLDVCDFLLRSATSYRAAGTDWITLDMRRTDSWAIATDLGKLKLALALASKAERRAVPKVSGAFWIWKGKVMDVEC